MHRELATLGRLSLRTREPALAVRGTFTSTRTLPRLDGKMICRYFAVSHSTRRAVTIISSFTEQHLQELGFAGFCSRRALPRGGGPVPSFSGVYAVTLGSSTHTFLDRSVGGHFKRNDPTVSPDKLTAKWVEGTATLYIGRANDLRKRIDLLARYGRGEPVAHQGGRYLWQLAEHGELLVSWRPEADPVQAETELLEDFESTVGQLPFANLVRGTSAQPLAA
jgi:hypothetical protein